MSAQVSKEMIEFDEFIANAELVDLPLIGRNYTWYRTNGSTMSRLDRFLVSKGWLEKWENSGQWAMERSISDHCPILLKDKVADWGPKPFRMLNCWMDRVDFAELVSKQWDEIKVDGSGASVMKEKLKFMKGKIKEWNKSCFGNLDSKIEESKKRIACLDDKGERCDLSAEEVSKRKECFGTLWQSLKSKESMLHQKSRLKWLKEGDVNPRYFHICINQRRRANEIVGINMGNRWIEEPNEVKNEVFEFFTKQFSDEQWTRPTPENVEFKKLSQEDGEWLSRTFTEEEVKEAIWDCDGNKSPGPDGYNFNFIKKFWLVLKGDLMKFMMDFW